ncbi:MAG TPA: bifunctional transaldolase/phosoglucose isomerase [Thermoanaerobaculaceae bacterium]|nr:bifunctional transaldolase/phosoglucose isomerase [Thermoanaerobaculaceae bacterium]
MNPLLELGRAGQSVWLDYIRRSFVAGGELGRLVREDGLGGVTSNPSIFEKAIAGSTDYREAIDALAGEPGLDAAGAYERLAVEDVRLAADVLLPVWTASAGGDGYASLEVSPRLAHDTAGTIAEAQRLWRELDRPNVMVKVPATREGLPAIERLIAEGVNVNVTLLFSVEVYAEVAEAFLRGLQWLAERGGDVGRVASVASFFVSRIDTEVDNRIEARLASAGGEERAALDRLRGAVAIANARVAYQRFREIFRGPRWEALATRGARVQRLLWASTSTKNPAYRDVRYVEELIGPDTVNTMPPATLAAFREHGLVRSSLAEDPAAAAATLAELERVGISLADVTTRLTEAGVKLFAEAFDKLLGAVETARAAHAGRGARPHRASLPPPLAGAVARALEVWQAGGNTARLWARDASLWTGADEARWLGWLGITDDQRAHLGRRRAAAEEIREAGFTRCVLLGMGGSSLAPDVLRRTFGTVAGAPELEVLDSTDPGQIRAVESRLDLDRTLFVVSSKSGTTVEPNLLMEYFLARVSSVVGETQAPQHFVVITDPGSALEHEAMRRGFRRLFHGVPAIGGRYSALSDFGMVPAAIAGFDVPCLLDRAEEMVHACASCVPAADNPGAALGVILGELAKAGRDKVTVVASPGIAGLGGWLEQLLAESTGKHGKGLVPVDGEPLGAPEAYGDDRVFAYLRLAGGADAAQDAAVARLEQAGQPVVRIELNDPHDLGREFFRWEFATAVAGAILGINPFDQPDVESAKEAARRLTAEYESSGALPAPEPLAADGDLTLYADGRNAAALRRGGRKRLATMLAAHLARLRRGDYFALLAYVAMDDANRAALEAIRVRVRDARGVATCLGFGPRFQHSTGQAYKGGPNSGVFLQVTHEHAADVPVPGKRLSFGVVEAAQAQGDLDALAERGRRLLRVHVRGDLAAGLARLERLVHAALE